MKYVFLLLLAWPVAQLSADERPHVLFIAIDDLNDWVGCLDGHPQAQTPNIDRLAAQGILFRNAHCAAPACNPSRAAVFSGRMPAATGVWSNDSGSLSRLYPNHPKLPETFQAAGYHTAGTGKLIHKGGTGFQQYQSFEQRWSPFGKQDVSYTADEVASKGTDNPRHVLHDSGGNEVILPRNRMPSDRRPGDPSGESFDWGGFDLPDSDWGDTQCTNWAIERLRRQRRKPLFLGVGYYRPHIPLFAPQRFFDRFARQPAQLPAFAADDLNDLSTTGRRWALEAVTAGSHATVVQHQQWQTAVEGYLACITYVDHEVGRLLEALQQSELADQTLIVLWSDHGWHLGEKQHWGKWTGWERSTRVPLIIVPPASQAEQFAEAGSVCDHPVSLVDLYPTLLELCQIGSPPPLDGVSLVPLLRDTNARIRPVTLTMFDRGNSSLRDHQYRYLRYKDGSEELYDLKADPHEWHNRAGEARYLPELQRLRAALQSQLDRSSASPGR